MFADKCQSIFSRQIEVVVYIYQPEPAKIPVAFWGYLCPQNDRFHCFPDENGAVTSHPKPKMFPLEMRLTH